MTDSTASVSNEKLRGRLTSLYEISKSLLNFKDVETSVPRILSIAAESFPLLSAVLIENIDGKVVTTTWPKPDLNQKKKTAVERNAEAAFAYFVDLSADQSALKDTLPPWSRI